MEKLSINSTKTLNNGLEMPIFGLGVFRVKDEAAAVYSVQTALEAGYRMIDTAAAYGNEEYVGRALRESGVRRDDVFITTKLWNANIREHRVREGLEASLEKLGVSYVDLYLVHWPVPELYLDAWKKMEQFYREGLVKAIGVCNCNPHHLDEILSIAEIVPAVNQVELHPYFNQSALRAYCGQHDIVVEGWSPLANGGLLDNEVLCELSGRHGKTPAQIVLRWHLQHNLVCIPKSVHSKYIYENADIFDFSLSTEEMDLIDYLDTGKRLFWDPDHFDF